jgi:hypothetical protein
VYGWVDPYYVAAAASIEPGHIWCDRPLYLPPRHGLKITRVNPQDDTDVDFKVCDGASQQIFDHAPIKSLRMESNEGALIAKTKRRRPVILLSVSESTEVTPRELEPAETVFAVPVYGADQYDEQTRKRMANYEFANVFYLAASDSPAFDEGLARLDHAQAVFKSRLSNHRGLKLSSDAFDALVEWFIAFSTHREMDGSLIREYREEMLAGERDANT